MGGMPPALSIHAPIEADAVRSGADDAGRDPEEKAVLDDTRHIEQAGRQTLGIGDRAEGAIEDQMARRRS